MLQHTFPGTFHNLITSRSMQKHAHKGILRNHFDDLLFNPKITFFPVNIFPETRPVKTVYGSDPILDLRFCLHRCKDCLIAAFGMSANHQRGIAGVFCNVPQIEPCRRLRRNRAFQCHIKIFSPADDRLICPAKCHIHRSVFQQKCNCRELHLHFFVREIGVIIEPHFCKTPASGNRRIEPAIVFFVPV